uniref:THO complex subunit 1 n=1 Tax=Emiliania huxleyi TaxID=2903 RepID=A0A7S3WPI0_EMIHU
MSADNFAAAQSRLASVLEEGVRADGLAGAAFVDSVVAAVRGAGASSGEAATSGAEGANGAAAKAEPLDAEERGTLELSMRIFLERKSSAGAAGALVVALIDRAIELATARAADLNTPFALMEDLFDSQVISESEALFPQIEQRGAALAKLMRSTNNRAKLTFIRTCNELLRRLSKSKNTNFCGRVLLLMAYMLPLSERSGVNLKGAMAPSDLELQPDEAADDKQEGSAAEDGSLYASFWGLQAAFADPAAAVKPESWATLVSRLETVLQVFANIVSTDAAPSAEAAPADPSPAGDEAAAASGGEGEDAEMEEAAHEMGREVYFAKFLTSPKLLQLQLRDAYFRRHVLVQLLIFVQTISTDQLQRKGAPALAPRQREAAEKLRARASELLAGIAPNGPLFAAALERLLVRERHWLEWKRDGCAAFDRAATEAESAPLAAGGAKKRRSGAAARAGGKRQQLGNSELSRLWNLGDNSLASIAAEGNKQAVPSLSAYLQPLVEQLDPEAGIEKEYLLTNDKVWMWKALRLMSKKDVSLLGKISAQGGSMEAAVNHFVEKQKGNAGGEEGGEATAMETE